LRCLWRHRADHRLATIGHLYVLAGRRTAGSLYRIDFKLGIESDHDVLEIGTGSGYQSAILARLARHVYTIERHAPLLEEARERFKALGIANVTAICGDGAKGWPEPMHFDRIILTANAKRLPYALVDQLKGGGRMILPLGRWPWQQKLVLYERTADGLKRQDLLPVRFVPLVS
jgi:protein-L-isoaspartate(D-aspartate) O-methyltransferase